MRHCGFVICRAPLLGDRCVFFVIRRKRLDPGELARLGGALAEPALPSLAWEGRFLVVGFAAGEIPKLPLNLVLLKSCDVRGIFWGAWIAREPEQHRANTAQLLAWCAAGKLSAHVHATYRLENAAAALHALSDRSVMGKVVLRP